MRRLILLAGVLGAAGFALAQEPDDRPSQAPSVDNSAVVVPAEPLPTPLPDPPPGLGDVPDTPQGRAAAHADVAEVLDVLGVRAARTASEDCATAPAVAMGLGLVHHEAREHLKTAKALLLGVDGTAAQEARLAELQGRLGHLEGLLVQARARASRCDRAPSSPAVFLEPRARGPVLGQVAVYTRGDGPSQVVWVDGTPIGVTGPDGWTVIVLEAGERTLCSADPRDAECQPGFRVDALMGAAFDLRR
jgi:hypothetical protein